MTHHISSQGASSARGPCPTDVSGHIIKSTRLVMLSHVAITYTQEEIFNGSSCGDWRERGAKVQGQSGRRDMWLVESEQNTVVNLQLLERTTKTAVFDGMFNSGRFVSVSRVALTYARDEIVTTVVASVMGVSATRSTEWSRSEKWEDSKKLQGVWSAIPRGYHIWRLKHG